MRFASVNECTVRSLLARAPTEINDVRRQQAANRKRRPEKWLTLPVKLPLYLSAATICLIFRPNSTERNGRVCRGGIEIQTPELKYLPTEMKHCPVTENISNSDASPLLGEALCLVWHTNVYPVDTNSRLSPTASPDRFHCDWLEVLPNEYVRYTRLLNPGFALPSRPIDQRKQRKHHVDNDIMRPAHRYTALDARQQHQIDRKSHKKPLTCGRLGDVRSIAPDALFINGETLIRYWNYIHLCRPLRWRSVCVRVCVYDVRGADAIHRWHMDFHFLVVSSFHLISNKCKQIVACALSTVHLS